MYAGCLKGIDTLFVERDSSNNPAPGRLPPYMPKELLGLDSRYFNQLVACQKERLLYTMDDSAIERIESDFRKFLKLKHRNPQLLERILALEEKNAGFNEVWKEVRDDFPDLHRFIAGFATTFANTATVEADFSLLGMEKTLYRHHLTCLSLQGILHCKQFARLNRLGVLE